MMMREMLCCVCVCVPCVWHPDLQLRGSCRIVTAFWYKNRPIRHAIQSHRIVTAFCYKNRPIRHAIETASTHLADYDLRIQMQSGTWIKFQIISKYFGGPGRRRTLWRFIWNFVSESGSSPEVELELRSSRFHNLEWSQQVKVSFTMGDHYFCQERDLLFGTVRIT